MKSFFFLIFFFLFYNIIQSQEPPSDTYSHSEISFYFSKGATTLGDDKRAAEVIKSFLEEQTIPTTDLFYLQGTVEDTLSSTLQLWQARTQSIQLLLLNYGIAPQQIITQKPHQIELTGDFELEEIRKEFRKITINWHKPKKKIEELIDLVEEGKDSSNIIVKIVEEEVPKVELKEDLVQEIEEQIDENKVYTTSQLDSFFSAQKEVEIFTFTADSGLFVKGKKGTIIQIMPNSLLDQEGNIVKEEVELSLQEVYSLRDMIVQAVQTQSDGRLLETGGMINLEARTLKGEKLTLVADKPITLVMASKQAQLANMQTFKGQKLDDGTINWVATNNKVLSQANRNIPKVKTKEKPVSQQSMMEIAVQLNDTFPTFKYDFPAVKPKPEQHIAKPKQPHLLANTKPSKDDLKEANPQKNKESLKDYNKRIFKVYQKKNRIYRKILIQNNKRNSPYKRKKIAYDKAILQQQKEKLVYEKYQKDVLLHLEQIKEEINQFDLEYYWRATSQLYEAFGGLRDKCDRMTSQINFMEISLLYYQLEGYPVSDILEKLVQKRISQKLKKVPASIDNIFRNYSRSNTINENKDIKKSRLADFVAIQHQIAVLSQHLKGKEHLTVAQIKQIKALNKAVYSDLGLRAKVNGYATSRVIVKNKSHYINLYIEAKRDFLELREEYLARKSKLGLFTNDELANSLGNALVSNTLGWINCDRFIDRNNLIDCHIIVDNKQNTSFYFIFADRNSILKATANYHYFSLSNVPKNADVQLIGIRVENKQTSYLKIKGKVKDFKNYTPVFENIEPEEVLNIITLQ